MGMLTEIPGVKRGIPFWNFACNLFVKSYIDGLSWPHEDYNEGADYHKPTNPCYLPFFKDCIGATDGTHVKARLQEGKYYVVDAGYPSIPGYITQYTGSNIKYNPQQFRCAQTKQARAPRGFKEKFNYSH